MKKLLLSLGFSILSISVVASELSVADFDNRYITDHDERQMFSNNREAVREAVNLALRTDDNEKILYVASKLNLSAIERQKRKAELLAKYPEIIREELKVLDYDYYVFPYSEYSASYSTRFYPQKWDGAVNEDAFFENYDVETERLYSIPPYKCNDVQGSVPSVRTHDHIFSWNISCKSRATYIDMPTDVAQTLILDNKIIWRTLVTAKLKNNRSFIYDGLIDTTLHSAIVHFVSEDGKKLYYSAELKFVQ